MIAEWKMYLAQSKYTADIGTTNPYKLKSGQNMAVMHTSLSMATQINKKQKNNTKKKTQRQRSFHSYTGSNFWPVYLTRKTERQSMSTSNQSNK